MNAILVSLVVVLCALSVRAFTAARMGSMCSRMRLSMSGDKDPGEEALFEPRSDRNRIVSAGSKLSTLAAGALTLGGLTVPDIARAGDDGGKGSVVVLGSNGQTGKLIVNLLAQQGVRVTPTYARTPPSSAPSGSSIQEARVADVTSQESLAAAVTGASAVIFAASASKKGGNAEKVDYLGVKNIAEVCQACKIPRLVVISSGAVTRPKSLGYKITNLFGGIMGLKLKGEDALRDVYTGTSLGYAIIRPGGLLSNAALGVGKVELNQRDTIAGEINRADVAECAAAAAISKSLAGKQVTFEIYNAAGGAPLEDGLVKPSGFEQRGDSYDSMFAGLKEGINRL